MRSDEEDLYVPSLQRPELARLIDFLDQVRVSPSRLSPAHETDTAGPQCHFGYLRHLWRMPVHANCSHFTIRHLEHHFR